MDISRKEMRDAIPKNLRKANDWKAGLLMSGDLFGYALTLLLTVLYDFATLQLLCGGLNGFFIGRLFIIGHDCCHGSFFSSKRLNRILGHVAFAPSLTSQSLWALGHNARHHHFTNLVPHDYAWAPTDSAVYTQMSLMRRFIERVYRHPLGHWIYYGIEIWWKTMFFPREKSIGQPIRKNQKVESWSLLAFWSATFSILIWIALKSQLDLFSAFKVTLIYSVAIPFTVWLMLAGFLTYIQHTSSKTIWYKNPDHWRVAKTEISATIYVDFNPFIDFLFHYVMHHTAHHIDPTIPVYNLPSAQAALDKEFGPSIVKYRGDLITYFKESFKTQLFDFDRSKWVSFSEIEELRSNSVSTLQIVEAPNEQR